MRLFPLVLLAPLTLACAFLPLVAGAPPSATEIPAPTPTATSRSVPALFAAQAKRFIELGTTIVATAPDGPLPTFRAQVNEMKGILVLLEQTGGDLFTSEAREFAHKAVDRWSAAVESWSGFNERRNNISGGGGGSAVGRPGSKELDLIDSAIVPFNSAKLRLIALIK